MTANLAAKVLPEDDSALLALEEKIFEANDRAHAYDDEIIRLGEAFAAQWKQLKEEQWAGRSTLTSDEIFERVKAFPETKEHDRLVSLTDPHHEEVRRLFEQMRAIPARTMEGRRAKLVVLLGCIMGEDWAADRRQGGIRDRNGPRSANRVCRRRTGAAAPRAVFLTADDGSGEGPPVHAGGPDLFITLQSYAFP
jgi:hypothetical protein